MHEDRSSCIVLLNLRSYAITCVLYYMHQLAMHHLDLHVLPKPKRVSGASTRYESNRYP